MACTKTGVSLSVLQDGERPTIGWARRWRLRLTILLIVQAAIIIHILVWWYGVPRGWSTLSPVEPSESIETVAEGIINAGAIFFAITLLSTAILGRWFCGWGCHVVLLQDWCLSLLRRFGIRPRAFRSRLLMAAPCVLAIYMFIWPIFYRLVWAPFVEMRSLHWPGFRVELLTRDLWATMPGVGVGIVFLFLCGFVTVYILGAKGFCTYACPYGGFFAPLDRLSLRRVTVNDSCEGCAHCTAACTSNVRVHEQVATWGKVIDVGCMKTTDCIEACPMDALSMQWSKPAIRPRMRSHAKKPKRQWDVSWQGDLALALLMLGSFLAWRGAYGLVPMLMSLGAAAIVTWCAWKGWRILCDRQASFHRRVLKREGKLTGSGVTFLLLIACVLGLTAQAAASQLIGMQGDRIAEGLRQQIDAPPNPNRPALQGDEALRAREALDWYRRARSMGAGGISLASDPNHLLASARLRAGLGDVEAARRLLAQTASLSRPNESVAQEQFMVEVSTQRPEVVLAFVRSQLEAHPDWHAFRLTASDWAVAMGDLRLAESFAGPVLGAKYSAIRLIRAGDLDGGRNQLRIYLESVPEDALGWITLGQIELARGDVEAADAAIDEAQSYRDRLSPAAQVDFDRDLAGYQRQRASLP